MQLTVFDIRGKNWRNILISHLNINSIQNKFEDLKLLNNQLKSQLIVITETKIDGMYPNAQFQLQYMVIAYTEKIGRKEEGLDGIYILVASIKKGYTVNDLRDTGSNCS